MFEFWVRFLYCNSFSFIQRALLYIKPYLKNVHQVRFLLLYTDGFAYVYRSVTLLFYQAR